MIVYEPNHQGSFWGDNCARLSSIKSSVDPNNLFSVWQGVGWAGPDDTLYQCYQQNRPKGVQLDN